MKKQYVLWRALLNALGVVLYVFLVANVFSHGEAWLGGIVGLWAPMTALLLLVFSVLVVGLFVFGAPIYYYLEGLKKEAWFLLLSTAGFLFLALLSIILFFALS